MHGMNAPMKTIYYENIYISYTKLDNFSPNLYNDYAFRSTVKPNRPYPKTFIYFFACVKL